MKFIRHASTIRALTLDLDDTLWPVAPALQQAENDLHAWLLEHHPTVAERFPIETMRSVREQVAAERPDLAHDFSEQRRLTLAHAFATCGVSDAPVDEAFEVYYAGRNRVTPYADSIDALLRISQHLPVVSLSNGNADLERIGLAYLFRARISAREVGVAKPHADIFHAACMRLGAAPATVLHVGDDPHADIAGARAAGLRTAWINREQRPWPDTAGADLECRNLAELADWLEAGIAAA